MDRIFHRISPAGHGHLAAPRTGSFTGFLPQAMNIFQHHGPDLSPDLVDFQDLLDAQNPLDGRSLVNTLRAFNVTYPLDALDTLDPLDG